MEIITQRQLRALFWETFPDLSRRHIPHGKTWIYPTDTRVTWVDWIDGLARDGQISQALAQRATL